MQTGAVALKNYLTVSSKEKHIYPSNSSPRYIPKRNECDHPMPFLSDIREPSRLLQMFHILFWELVIRYTYIQKVHQVVWWASDKKICKSLSKIPAVFSTENDKLILTSIWEIRGTQNSQNFLKMKNVGGVTPISKFTAVTVTKTVWY